MSASYKPEALRKLQQYRAVVEQLPSSQYDSLVNKVLLSLPAETLELIITELRGDASDAGSLPNIQIREQCDQLSEFVITETEIPTPYPRTHRAQLTDANMGSIEFALMVEELAPMIATKAGIDANNPLEIVAANYGIEQMDTDHKRVATARLNRIDETTDVEPFEKVTAAEMTYCFSHESRHNSGLVNPTGVGMMTGALKDMIEEMGQDPDDMLPPGFMQQPVGYDLMDLNRGQDVPPVGSEESDIRPVASLVEEFESEQESLKINLKYLRDCAYLRDLHEILIRKIPIEDPSCPKLVWKDAALDIQNESDPFAPDVTDRGEDETVPTENVLRVKGGETIDTNTDTTENSGNMQTGLGQF
jgi:hypothetical protein